MTVVYISYLALDDFSGGLFEERRPGREEVLLGVLLQAAVATAHGAIPRHLRRKRLDSNPSKPPGLSAVWREVTATAHAATGLTSSSGHRSAFLLSHSESTPPARARPTQTPISNEKRSVIGCCLAKQIVIIRLICERNKEETVKLRLNTR